jgi:hypothetical protein
MLFIVVNGTWHGFQVIWAEGESSAKLLQFYPATGILQSTFSKPFVADGKLQEYCFRTA